MVEGGPLHGVDVVRVITDDLGHGGLADLTQLSLGEADQRVPIFVPERRSQKVQSPVPTTGRKKLREK